MKKSHVLWLSVLVIICQACSTDFTLNPLIEQVKGWAYLVEDVRTKKPLENCYVEVVYQIDNGDEQFLTSTFTNEKGYFYIEGKFNTQFDFYDVTASVYATVDKIDTIGVFPFYFNNDKLQYHTLLTDTFSLEHRVWLIPRIKNLDRKPTNGNKIKMHFKRMQLVDPDKYIQLYQTPIVENQTLDTFQMQLDMYDQHWLARDYKILGEGVVYNGHSTLFSGDFKIQYTHSTAEDDTLFVDFIVDH